MTRCLNQGCENPVTSVVGRRPRLYCSNTCRQKDWQRKQKQIEMAKAGVAALKDVPGYENITKVGILNSKGKVTQVTPVAKIKPVPAPKPEKLPNVPKKEDTGGKGAQNASGNEATPPEGLTEIQLMVWKNEQKKKNNPKPPAIEGYGLTKKQKPA